MPSTQLDTLSHRRPLRFWGWGYADQELASEEVAAIRALASGLSSGAGLEAVRPPEIADVALPPARIRPPSTLEAIVSSSAYDRLVHTYGKSFADGVRMLMREAPAAPDAVAFPRSEQQIVDVLDWAAREQAAVVPFGGGSSVCGGVEPDVGEGYRATISLDLQYLNRVIEVDTVSRAALIEAGALGPELEAQLRPHGLTLRHFPQSFEFSTLGGWIATRAGGHFASVYTHIDDLVESTRMVTPEGVVETRRLPGSGAGPSADRMVLGSEGTLGVVTQAWMRLQDRPTHRASASVTFPTMTDATAAVRTLSQSGLFPTNCRLLDPAEVAFNGLGEGDESIVVLGFESADHPLDAWLARALEIASEFGGSFDAEAAQRSLKGASEAGSAEHLRGAAGAWRNAFLRMPYWRNLTTPLGLIVDTFESAIPWNRFEKFYAGVKERVGRSIEEVTGQRTTISCRFTHIYPDGPAPYFTFTAIGTDNGDLASALDRWRDIKRAANEAVVDLGGTITHHHAVGRDHRGGYERQTSPVFREMLRAAKRAVDPSGLLNPGVLIDPPGNALGARGALNDDRTRR
jgi:alkyldihydroxyacetonephosphate synthase